MEIYIIRHTTPDIPDGLIYGQMDVDLNPDFEKEAGQVLKKLSRKVNYVFSSPLTRCLKLATLISEDVVTDTRLMELDFGEWEGQKWDNINKKELQRWMADYVKRSPPGGESMQDLEQRALSFWNDLKGTEAECIAVVTHAGIIRTLCTYVKKQPLVSAFDMEIPFGAVLRINDDTPVIDYL